MSQAEAQRFLTDCESDSALKSKMMATPGDTPEERIAAIKSAGYDVTMADFKTKGPMEDSALEDVAGGLFGWPWWWPLVFPGGKKKG